MHSYYSIFLSAAVINTITKCDSARKGFAASSQSITEKSGLELKAGTWRQERKQTPPAGVLT